MVWIKSKDWLVLVIGLWTIRRIGLQSPFQSFFKPIMALDLFSPLFVRNTPPKAKSKLDPICSYDSCNSRGDCAQGKVGSCVKRLGLLGLEIDANKEYESVEAPLSPVKYAYLQVGLVTPSN
ncbi:hypothetical protein DFH05DRAFT_1508330 [Lentinula detonsa]|uniref:Uncharacterized protein n=1 Tax=Lentinula detonsa TaxID=2804962 RepID=A0A9W8NUC1_9AGAR|nr:hypothetical protein DFH05DRAFT_1508330 [Lentinula detonsa]